MRTPDDVLVELVEGNRRFMRGDTHERDLSAERAKTVGGQSPKAIVMGCSDSRVPAELLFDQGIGDLFVIRTAGHILGEASVHSIEFAIEALGVPLIVVLGHTDCAAVKAGVHGTGGKHAAEWLAQQVRSSLAEEPSEDGHAHDAEAVHARCVARRVAALPGVADAISAGTVAVHSAVYDVGAGSVRFD